MSYFCPECKTFFEVPDEWVSPCCGAETNGGSDYNCPECGEKFAEDEEIPKCPTCGNIGGHLFSQPDHEECYERLYPEEFKKRNESEGK